MRNSDHARDRLTVVGGGLVGSLLAVYLARRGFGVDVFERQPDPRMPGPRSSRPSINLTLCERGLAALDAVGLKDRVLALTVPVYGRRIHLIDGSTAFQPYSNRGEAIHSISRNELNAVLVAAAERERGVAYHFDQKCTGLDSRGGTVSFEHAVTKARTEVGPTKIFGADGAYSGVRLQLQKTELFDYSQQYSPQGYKELAIPAGPEGRPVLEADALHIWPRGDFMLIAFPNRDGSFTCGLYAPFHGEHSFASLTTEERLVAFMHEQFPDIAPCIPSIAEQFFARSANTMVTVRCRPWSRHGNVLLVGDAAHSILPSYGQGANAGFEDCAVLDRCIERHPNDWRGVFAELEELRRPEMDVMADLCVEHFYELREHVAEPRFLLRKAVERRLQELYPERFASLYSLVAFTRTPYSEAVRIESRQRALVDRILAVDGIEQKFRSEMTTLVEHCLQEVA
ncbi:MAG: FAD-dependent monooxygenase [Myxococcales bacterium]|nr:FAD-dependent monooxygenase [Myxococcales bacterium]